MTPGFCLRRRAPWTFVLGLSVSFLVAVSDASAQIAAPARPALDYKNAVSGGVSYGIQNARDADFWGFSFDYSRTLNERWITALALTWDSETETFADRPDRNTKTFTLVGTMSFAPTDWLSITSGLGKGFADTDNPARTMRFSNGDLGTGFALGFALPGLPLFVRD